MFPLWILAVVAVIALIISWCFGIVLIPYLHKLHFGQPIKVVDGPKWHEKKQGTPTMGGFMFILASVVAFIVGFFVFKNFSSFDFTVSTDTVTIVKPVALIVYCLLFAAMGFADDFIKVAKKHNLGLKAWQKVVIQVVISAAFMAVLYFAGDKSTEINLSFVKFDIGIFYYPLMLLVMIYLTNAVNLTDGVDGLCGSVTVITMLAYTVASTFLKFDSTSIFTVALAGALVGFLRWNYNPAKCFMGDTGSMYLGAAVTGTGIILHQHLLLVLVSMVYIIEALSVVIQVSYFKYTKKKYGEGRRIFKMTPIHHHFEMSGFSEYKICFTFSSAAIVFSVLAIVLMILCK